MSIFLTILTVVFQAQGITSKELKKSLINPPVINPLINEVVEYKAVKGHHFNLEAPQDCGSDSTIKATAKTISCQFHSDGERVAVVSVCDNKKTYCKQEKVKALVQKIKSAQSRIKETPDIKTLKMQKGVKEKLLSRFKIMTPAEAIQAIPMKKAALVMVSADWCPPCNQAKEFMLQTEAFKNTTKDLLLIYVDGDSPSSEEWNLKLKTRYYPSFVVLNKELERVSVFSDIYSESHIKKLNEALKLLDDPLKNLQKRLAERDSGEFFRKVKDFFYSSDDLAKDHLRHLEYLASVGDYDSVLEHLEKTGDNKLFNKIKLESYFLSSKENTTELLEKFLNQDPNKSPFYYYALQEYCGKTKEDNNFSKACMGYRSNYLKSLEIKESWPEEEKKLRRVLQLKTRANLASFFNEEAEAKKLFTECAEAFNSLYDVTPLKDKSRSVRIEQIGCMKDSDQSVELLKSLASDYPFEETFHRKLAKHYAKNNNYKKALESNQKAIDYSYGYMWIYNVSERADYLRKTEKNKEALTLVESALSEVVLNKEDARLNRALKSLRAQYDALRVL